MEAQTAAEIVPADLRPLVLDLDNTLIRTDVLHELALSYVKANPLNLFRVATWTFRGRAYLKHRLSQAALLNVDALPVNEELVAYATAEKATGRLVVLATATDGLVARRIARRFPFIDQVISTENGVNLKGPAKAKRLAELFPDGFVYVGDSIPDLSVWQVAKSAIVVSDSPRLARRAARVTEVQQQMSAGGAATAMFEAMRPHQWAKNALVFAPLILAGMTGSGAAWFQAAIAFLALSLLASATYVLNDLSDLQEDRLHWSKKSRAIARGALSIPRALALFGALTAAAVGLAMLTNPLAIVLLLLYAGLTIAYSLSLKRQPITDAFVLATLFTLRIGLGIAAVGAESSAWLLVFSMFLFGSLSLAKRYTEIARMIEHGRKSTAGRGYIAADGPLVLAMGIASGIGAVVIMVLYLINDAFAADFYVEPILLWSFPSILFLWISRVWLLSHRGELHDDPVAFAVKDRTSILMAAGMGLTFLVAMTGIHL